MFFFSFLLYARSFLCLSFSHCISVSCMFDDLCSLFLFSISRLFDLFVANEIIVISCVSFLEKMKAHFHLLFSLSLFLFSLFYLFVSFIFLPRWNDLFSFDFYSDVFIIFCIFNRFIFWCCQIHLPFYLFTCVMIYSFFFYRYQHPYQTTGYTKLFNCILYAWWKLYPRF